MKQSKRTKGKELLFKVMYGRVRSSDHLRVVETQKPRLYAKLSKSNASYHWWEGI